MPLFVIYCRDREDGLETRMATREAHLAYIAENRDHMFTGGPLMENDTMAGSLLIVDFPGLAEAKVFAAADPYTHAGLFSSVTISEWKKVIG